MFLRRFTLKHPSTFSILGRRFESTEAATVLTPTKPRMSAFRGSLIGFLIGTIAAGTSGYYFLLKDYQIANALLLNSVKDLQGSTNKVKAYAAKIDTLNKDLESLKSESIQNEQLQKLRNELRSLYNSVSSEVLELKTQVGEIEKEVHVLSK